MCVKLEIPFRSYVVRHTMLIMSTFFLDLISSVCTIQLDRIHRRFFPANKMKKKNEMKI